MRPEGGKRGGGGEYECLKRQENGEMLGKERRQAWREKYVSSIPGKAGGWGGETRESPCTSLVPLTAPSVSSE